MKKQLINEIGRINEIMGTPPLLTEQATIIKWLKGLMGAAEAGGVYALKFSDFAAKIPALTDSYVLTLLNAGVFGTKKGSPKTINAAKKAIARGLNDFMSGQKIASSTAEVLVRLADESDDFLKIFAKEMSAKASAYGLKMQDILQSNELRVQFQKLLADGQIGINLKKGIPDSVLSKIADDFIAAGGKLDSIITDGWWARLWEGVSDIDLSRIYAIDVIFNKFLTNKTYFNVKHFITSINDPAISKKLLRDADSSFTTADDVAEAVTNALAKGQQLGRAELEALQTLMQNSQKYRSMLYQELAQSQYVKSIIRDIPINNLTAEQVEKMFQKIIRSEDPNDLILFKNSLGFEWNVLQKRFWTQIIDPVTYKYTFLKVKDIFFSPTRYPKFTRFYWGAMALSGIINLLMVKWPEWDIIPKGETKAEAGLKSDFYNKLKGAKTLLLDEGGLDDEQALVIAKMLNNMLNFFFNMETDMDDLYQDFTAYTQTVEYKGNLEREDLKNIDKENLYTHREVFKDFSKWIETQIEDGVYAPAVQYITGVSDEGIQGVYRDLIPTVLASSQVTHFYDSGIHKKLGALKTDLEKLQPIIHWLPIPILTRTFGDGIEDIHMLLDDKNWMNSVKKGEQSLAEIIDVAVSFWPTFPETLLNSDEEVRWCKWSGPIPPEALATLMDGDKDEDGAKPTYVVGQDQQNWLKSLSAEEFNRGFCLAAEGKCESPYGWTDDEIDSMEVKVLETEKVLSAHMLDFFSDLKHVKELLKNDPERLCAVSPRLCELLKIASDAHNAEVESPN